MPISAIYVCFLWNFLSCIIDFIPLLAPTDSTNLILLFITFSNILHTLFVNDIPILFSNSSLSDFPLSMLMVFDLFHEIGIVSFSNILLNVWDNAFVNLPPPYFMNSFFYFVWSCTFVILKACVHYFLSNFYFFTKG